MMWRAKIKKMYNGKEDILILSPPYYLGKANYISCTMHYLLLSSLTISKNQCVAIGITCKKEEAFDLLKT
jgi:hypothetical protein